MITRDEAETLYGEAITGKDACTLIKNLIDHVPVPDGADEQFRGTWQALSDEMVILRLLFEHAEEGFNLVSDMLLKDELAEPGDKPE